MSVWHKSYDLRGQRAINQSRDPILPLYRLGPNILFLPKRKHAKMYVQLTTSYVYTYYWPTILKPWFLQNTLQRPFDLK